MSGATQPDAAVAVSSISALSVIGKDRRAAASSIDVVNPSDETIVGTVAAATPEDCLDAVAAAHEALPAWASTPPRDRAEMLRAAWESMTVRKDEIADLIIRENGKTMADALSEVSYAAEFFRWYSEEAVRISGEIRTAPAGDKRIMTLRQPVGVSLLITPWNFPAAMATRKLAPALAAGCTVVLKPARDTPLTAFAIAELLAESGVPAGVINVVCPESTADGVSAMMRDSRVRALSFTGSTEVGTVLLGQAAPGILRCSMELGGNAPFIVLKDANIEAAVSGAVVAKMRNGGASCIAANRFYVHAAVAKQFTMTLAQRLGDMQMGSGADAATQLGPLVSKIEQIRVSELVEAAAVGGAVVEIGGVVPDRPGFFYPATVLSNVARDAGIIREEIFGPVAPIVTFEDEADVVTMANGSGYGLAAYIYSASLARALRVGEALECGIVGVNRGFVSDPAAPFGGVKRSGLGREGGADGIQEFLETKYLALDWSDDEG